MLTVFAPAKINLALDVTNRRPDGYHDVDMVMQTIGLADQITLENHPTLELTCNIPALPTDARNLAWRAVKLLQESAGVERGVKIHITKRIPLAAGLAGGSADAAAVLTALNDLWQLGLTTEQLAVLGLKLGADVPFCIRKGCMRAQGIGEVLTPIRSHLRCQVLLVKPNIEVSTALVYKRLNLDSIQVHPDLSRIVQWLERGDLSALTAGWGNVLEEVALRDFPAVAEVKKILRECGLTQVLMSGSGPTVFALDPSSEGIERLMARVPRDWFVSLTHFIHP